MPPAGDPASLPPASDPPPPPDDPDEPPVALLLPELPEPPEDGVPPPDPLPVLPPELPPAPQRLELFVEQSASWRLLVAELNLLKMLLWKASIAASTRQLTKAKRIMYSERP